MMPSSDRGPRPVQILENDQDDPSFTDSATRDALQNEDQFSDSDTSSIESVAISEEDKIIRLRMYLLPTS